MPQDSNPISFPPMAMDRINSITNSTARQTINIKMTEISQINSNSSNIGKNMPMASSNQLTKTANQSTHKKKSKISLTLFLASNMRRENKLREALKRDQVRATKIKIHVPFV